MVIKKHRAHSKQLICSGMHSVLMSASSWMRIDQVLALINGH